MTPRDTRTGRVLEEMIIPALKRGGYQYETQKVVGQRLGGGRHTVDIVATGPNGERYLISLKWQQVSGTAEQKVPFEAMCLAEAIRDPENDYEAAYLVLGGAGWKLRDFYVSGALRDHLIHADLVTLMTLEDFVAKVNAGEL